MHPDLWLTVIAAAVILAAIYRILVWWYLPKNLPGPDEAELTGEREAVRGGESSSDDDWAGVLHIINEERHQNRPVAQLTHYEVEAVIRQLGVAEWVPERWRAAA